LTPAAKAPLLYLVRRQEIRPFYFWVIDEMLLLGVVGSFEPKLKHGKRANKKQKKNNYDLSGFTKML
jgi:hypothetical protein